MKDLFAIYLRKSRKDLENKDYDVLRRHKRILLDFAQNKNIPIYEDDIYEEVVSGETIQDRPVIQELLKKIESGYYRAVLVMEIERLARGNTIDQGIIAQAFQLTNTLIITPNKTYDTANEYDNEFLEFGLFMSRREYKTINRRIQLGRKQSVKEGNFIGSITPYGYDKEKLIGEKGFKLIPNDEAENVKLIFDLFLKGYGTSNLSYKLNDLNIKSKSGKQWTPAMVRNVLINRVYIGYLSWGKRAHVKKLDNNSISKTRPVNNDYLEFKGKHEPLIDEETFNKTQELLKNNSIKKVVRTKQLQNPLAGLIICSKCGNTMVRRPYSNGYPDTLYCKNKYCDNVSSALYLVENKIIEALSSILKEYYYYLENFEKEYVKECKNYELEIKKINTEITKLKKQHEKACEMLELGAYTVELFKERSSILNSNIQSLDKRKEELIALSAENKNNKIIKSIPKLEICLNSYKDASIEEKNKLLKSILNKVYYLKDSGGRWNKDNIDNFLIEFELNL